MNSEISRFRSPVVRVFDCHIARAVGDDYEFLLLRRAEDKIYGGDWRMVGGKLQGEETAWHACLREVAEETGLRIQRLLVVPFVNRFYEWKHDRINDIPVFVALTDDAEPRLDAEHTRFVWLTSREAASRLPWPGQRDGLIAANALLKDNLSLQRHMEIDFSA